MDNKTKLDYMRKRIKDDTFWLKPLAEHLLEENDIVGAYRVIHTMVDLELFKNYADDFEKDLEVHI